jgi:hypothetical protein
MPASLLDSQLDTLEAPTETEPAIRVDAGPDATLVVDRLLRDLGLTSKALPVASTPKKTAGATKATTAKPSAKKPAAPKRPPRAKS